MGVKRTLDRWAYRLDNFFTRGITAQFAVLFVLMVALILSGTIGIKLGLFDPANKDVAAVGHKYGEGFWDAVWWSTMHIFDPSYVSQDYGATTAVVMLGLGISLLGLILFGGVIGLVSAGVERKLDELSAGSRAVAESGHVLILGWNTKIFSILDLFEDYHRPVRVVILAPRPIAEMAGLLRVGRGRSKRIRPVVRSGSPTQYLELERMSFKTAHSVIVLADESQEGASEEPDLRTIKTLMLLAEEPTPGGSRPKMVAEIVRRENLEVARVASRGSISLICSSEVLSRMIVQTSRQPGLTHVYDELFGFSGSEIFIQEHPQGVGRSFGDLIFEFPEAVLLGTSMKEQREGRPYFRQLLNPGNDHELKTGEWLILLAEDSGVAQRPRRAGARETDFAAVRSRERVIDRVLILGWNGNLYNILQEYDRFLAPGSEITIGSHFAPERARAMLAEALGRPLAHATLAFHQVDSASPAPLERVLEGGYGTCIVLADESNQEREPDARTIVTVLLVRDYERRHPEGKFKQVIAEVLSAANAELLHRHNKTETIVSPRLVSMLLAQVSQQLMLERVYAEMMNANANEIYLQPMGRFTSRPETCTFTDVMRAASKLGEIAIGIKRRAEAEDRSRRFGVRLNPPKDTPLKLASDDEVIVISAAGSRLA